MTTVYLSGAMEKVNVEQGKVWRKRAKNFLIQYEGFRVIDPYDYADELVNEDGTYRVRAMVEIDKKHIIDSDVVIVNTEHPGVGTPCECMFAFQNGKQVYMFGGSKNPWYLYHATEVFDTLDDLLARIVARYITPGELHKLM